jgi:hypothetical protein
MKLSEKIQEALRQQQEINLSDPVVQKRLAAQWGYVPADAQPAPSFADAYQGAMEEAAIWKKRALEAEDLNRKFIAEINGPTHMGEPAQPAPSVPDGWLRAIDESLVVANIGVANPDDTYEQAKAKLDNLIGFHVDVATDPAVNGGWKLVPRPPTPGMMRGAHRLVAAARRVLASADSQGLIRLDESGDVASELRSALEAAPEAKP